MPTLALTCNRYWPTWTGSVASSLRRRATSSAPDIDASVLNRTANSSPPRRAIVSQLRSRSDIRRAISRSSASPYSWPRASLTSLNWSRSTIRSPTGAPVRSASMRARVRRSCSRARFGSPVRASWVAWWRNASAVRARLVMSSSEIPTHRSGSGTARIEKISSTPASWTNGSSCGSPLATTSLMSPRKASVTEMRSAIRCPMARSSRSARALAAGLAALSTKLERSVGSVIWMTTRAIGMPSTKSEYCRTVASASHRAVSSTTMPRRRTTRPVPSRVTRTRFCSRRTRPHASVTRKWTSTSCPPATSCCPSTNTERSSGWTRDRKNSGSSTRSRSKPSRSTTCLLRKSAGPAGPGASHTAASMPLTSSSNRSR